MRSLGSSLAADLAPIRLTCLADSSTIKLRLTKLSVSASLTSFLHAASTLRSRVSVGLGSRGDVLHCPNRAVLVAQGVGEGLGGLWEHYVVGDTAQGGQVCVLRRKHTYSSLASWQFGCAMAAASASTPMGFPERLRGG